MSTLRVSALQNPSAASAALSLANDGSAAAVLSSINGGQLAGMRNRIINGDFSVWQRGTSRSTSTYGVLFGPDRWIANVAGSGTPTTTLSRQTFSPGQTDVPGEPDYYLRTYTTTTNAFSSIYFGQRIENVRIFAGSTITISFYIRHQAGAFGNYFVSVLQNFGSGGSVSVSTTASTFSISSSWSKYTVTISVPSVSGKTIGTGSYFEFAINTPLTTTSFDIAQVQIESGAVATPFEFRGFQQELALCQRYCLVDAPSLTEAPLGVGYYTSTTSAAISYKFPVEMRAAPTLTTSAASNFSSLGSSSVTAIGSRGSNTKGIRLDLTVTGGTTGYAAVLQSSGTGASLTFEAEL